MLNLIVGPAKSGKTTLLVEKLQTLTKNRLVCDDILVIQPSNEACNNFFFTLENHPIPGIRVLTFRLLANEIIKNSNIKLEKLKYGYSIFLELALRPILKSKSNAPEIDLIRNWSQSTSKTNLYQTLTDLMREGISDTDLKKLGDKSENELVTNTCYAFAMILKNYGQTLENFDFYDETESESLALRALKSTQLNFNHVFIDNFNRFTQTQIDIIKALCLTANVDLTLCSDLTKDNDLYFKFSNRLYSRLIDKIKNEVEISVTHLDESMKSSTPDISDIVNNINAKEPIEDCDNIKIISADSAYEEIEKVAIEIKKLLVAGDCATDNISVVYRSNAPYADIIANIFNKYCIPTNSTRIVKLNETTFFKFFLHLLDFQIDYNENFDEMFTEQKLNRFLSFITETYSKKLLSKMYDTGLKEDDVSKFAEKFRESGLFSYKLIHDSLSDDLEEDSFVSKRTKIFNANEKVILKNIVGLFTVSESNSFNWKSSKKLLSMLTQYLSVEESIIEIVNEIYDFYNKLNANSYDFIPFLRTLSNEIKVPQTKRKHIIKHGNIATIQHNKAVKIVFIVGLNQNVFPIMPSPSAILTDKVRNAIAQFFDIDLHTSFHEFEDFLFYKALSSTKHKLYLTFSRKNLQGSELNPSIFLYNPLFARLLKSSQNIRLQDVFLPGFLMREFLRNQKSDNLKFSQEDLLSFVADTDIAKHLAEYKILKSQEYTINHKNYKLAVKTKPYLKLSHFTNKSIEKTISDSNLIFSHSSLKNYLTCPYKFLVESIFKIKEIKQFTLDAGEWGNLFHSAMEEFAYHYAELVKEKNHNEILNYKQDIISNSIKTLEDKFRRNYLIYETKSDYRKLQKNIDQFRKFLEKEIARRSVQSASPVAVELAFGIPYSEGTKTPLIIDEIKSQNDKCLEINNGSHSIKIRGFIDLIDEVEINSEKFYLIIDYKKTSNFDKYISTIERLNYKNLDEIWAARKIIDYSIIPILNFQHVDLQLPIYLLAMKKVFKVKNANSAMFYHLFNRGFTGFIESNLSNQVSSDFYPGRIFDKVNKTMDKDEINSLLNSTEKLIIQIIELMKSGEFPIAPDVTHPQTKTVCEYCPYASICRIDTD